MKLWAYLLAAAALVTGAFGAAYLLGNHPGGERSGVLSKVAWQRMASPGALSRAHTFLEHNCAACHTAVQGAQASNCIACHANNESLLHRQPTAFHADVGSCVECHVEHQGVRARITQMDHAAFARLSLRQLRTTPTATTRPMTDANAVRDVNRIAAWIGAQRMGSISADYPNVTPAEATLNCVACHANQDRHREFFGTDCAQCHGTTKWTIPEFRHPLPTSTSCVQCHQAPPSHYMMHFQMISMKVAGQEHAQVSECFKCHQTTAWNDIKGVGWYKHH